MATRMPRPGMAQVMLKLARAMTGYDTRPWLVSDGAPAPGARVLASGARAVRVGELLQEVG